MCWRHEHAPYAVRPRTLLNRSAEDFDTARNRFARSQRTHNPAHKRVRLVKPCDRRCRPVNNRLLGRVHLDVCGERLLCHNLPSKKKAGTLRVGSQRARVSSIQDRNNFSQ